MVECSLSALHSQFHVHSLTVAFVTGYTLQLFHHTGIAAPMWLVLVSPDTQVPASSPGQLCAQVRGRCQPITVHYDAPPTNHGA